MPVVVKGNVSRNAGHHYGQIRVQRVEGVTADGAWTADTLCITADGRIVCIPTDVVEPTIALDAFDAEVIAGGAVIDADLAEAAAASDLADAISDVAADAVESADALDALDADVVAAGAVIDAEVVEPVHGIVTADSVLTADSTLWTADGRTDGATENIDATVGAQVLFGTVDEAAAALDHLDAAVVPLSVVDGGGGYYPPLQRPFPIVGHGYGVLPELWGEAHGVVGAVAKGAAQVVVHATAVGASGQSGNAAVILKNLSVAAHGAVGARGAGEGMIVKFSGSATGRHDDDEAAVVAFLLAA